MFINALTAVPTRFYPKPDASSLRCCISLLWDQMDYYPRIYHFEVAFFIEVFHQHCVCVCVSLPVSPLRAIFPSFLPSAVAKEPVMSRSCLTFWNNLLLTARLLSTTCYKSTLKITPYRLSENSYSVYLQPPSVSEPKQNSYNLPSSGRQFQSYASLSITVGLFDFVEGKRLATIQLNFQEIGYGETCTVLIWPRTGTSGGFWWTRK